MTFCMGERKQKGLLTVTLIAVTDCHISSFTLNLLNTTFQIKFALALCEDLFTKGSYRSERPALSGKELRDKQSSPCSAKLSVST